MIAFRIDEQGFEQQMGHVLSQARRPEGVLAVAGREGANQLRKHFLEKDRTDVNKLAPDRREHLWQQFAHAVQAPVVDAAGNRVTIAVNHPVIAQKVFGGTITAKRGVNLAIPEAEQAYGRAPAVFEQETGLTLIFVKANDHIFLAARIDKDSKSLQVEYLLTPSVHQEADPTALPDEAEWKARILARSQEALDRQLKEGTK